MNFIKHSLFWLTCLGIITSSSDAKQLEFLLDKASTVEINLDGSFDDSSFLRPDQEREIRNPSYCQKIVFENKGDLPLQTLVPATNGTTPYTLKKLSKRLSRSDFPLQTLYNIWTSSVVISEKEDLNVDDPLYILNYKGYCNKESYVKNFIQLCGLLGIDVRPVVTQQGQVYDFSYRIHHWDFLDLINRQLFLDWNNRTLVSSEELMDDPLLILRTKANRNSNSFDFVDSWKQVANFEIIKSYLPDPLLLTDCCKLDVSTGFTLNPKEILTYSANPQSMPLHCQQWLIDHQVQPQSLISYGSLFPLKEINNATNKTIKIEGVELPSGESYIFSNPTQFLVNLAIEQLEDVTGVIHVFSVCSKNVIPQLSKGKNKLDLETKNPSSILVTYFFDDSVEEVAQPNVKVINEEKVFDHVATEFKLEVTKEVERIWWQLSSDPKFTIVVSNFDQVVPFTEKVTIPQISETFLNPDEHYYFRVKGFYKDVWSDWSDTFAFKIKKPEPVGRIDFNKMDEKSYEISWQPTTKEEDAEYLIFASNALDFIPSIYTDTQINGIVNNEVTEKEGNDNLKAVTKEPKIIVDGLLPYYRIVVRQKNQFSVPSPIVHVFDEDLHHVRNVLQMDETGAMKRTKLPISQPEDLFFKDLLVSTAIQGWQNKALSLPYFYLNLDKEQKVEFKPWLITPYVTQEVWEAVRKYFLPENHPVRPKLDRIFGAKRVTQTPQDFKDAGFLRNRVGRFSRIMASSHPQLQGYFVKAFSDMELGIKGPKADWVKLTHRIEGAKSIKACIYKYGLQNKFKVPKKWLYPLPADPSPPKTAKFLRKNFVLIAEDCRIYDHEKNNRMYKKEMTTDIMDALYIIISECGLADSLYAFNVPFCKDGKLAFIDTEYHHKWPVNYKKFGKYFSSEMNTYWDKLIKNNGPLKKQPVAN